MYNMIDKNYCMVFALLSLSDGVWGAGLDESKQSRRH